MASLMRCSERRIRTTTSTGTFTPFLTGIKPYAAGATGIGFVLYAYYALTWHSFSATFNVCAQLFCDFVDYFYPMGEAIFHTGLPVDGFLYSPFNAILLAVFPPLGLNTSLVLWGILQVLFVVIYLLLFRRLVPARLPIQLLFIALTLSSFPVALNFLGGGVCVFMTVAILGLLVFYERGHLIMAASLLIFAVSFKFYPIIFLIPFLAARNVRFLLVAAAACVFFLLIVPGVFLGVGETFGFYGVLFDSFRDSDWVVANPHSQFFPHVVLRLTHLTGYDAQPHLLLLHLITYGIAIVNMGLIFLIQRAHSHHANLWSFQILFLTIPFILKTSWAHDFVFLSFSQGLMVWRLLGNRTLASVWREGFPCARTVVMIFLLLLSVVVTNIVFFNLFDNFYDYGFYGFIFWADVLLLIAFYVELLPPALRQFRGTDAE